MHDDSTDTGRHWDDHADEWTAWARTPGHDAYWSYREAFATFLPPPGRATLEVGCGEGRIARDLTALGHTVTATDIAPRLVAAARTAGSARHHLVADTSALPFPDESFDRVVAYNVLMDVPDVPAAVAEAGRVLGAGGVLTVSIVHPFSDRGRFVDGTFVVPVSYFGHDRFAAEEQRDGLTMLWAGWSLPLQDYIGALNSAGLAVIDLQEPRPSDSAPDGLDPWRRMPLFLWLNAVAPG